MLNYCQKNYLGRLNWTVYLNVAASNVSNYCQENYFGKLGWGIKNYYCWNTDQHFFTSLQFSIVVFPLCYEYWLRKHRGTGKHKSYISGIHWWCLCLGNGNQLASTSAIWKQVCMYILLIECHIILSFSYVCHT